MTIDDYWWWVVLKLKNWFTYIEYAPLWTIPSCFGWSLCIVSFFELLGARQLQMLSSRALSLRTFSPWTSMTLAKALSTLAGCDGCPVIIPKSMAWQLKCFLRHGIVVICCYMLWWLTMLRSTCTQLDIVLVKFRIPNSLSRRAAVCELHLRGVNALPCHFTSYPWHAGWSMLEHGSDGSWSGHQDWALMNLRFEISLLMQFFRQDCSLGFIGNVHEFSEKSVAGQSFDVIWVIFTTAAHSICQLWIWGGDRSREAAELMIATC